MYALFQRSSGRFFYITRKLRNTNKNTINKADIMRVLKKNDVRFSGCLIYGSGLNQRTKKLSVAKLLWGFPWPYQDQRYRSMIKS